MSSTYQPNDFELLQVNLQEETVINLDAVATQIQDLNESVQNLTKAVNGIAEALEQQSESIQQAFAPSDFTGWNLAEAISILALELRNK